MEIRSRTFKTAKRNELVHDSEKCSGDPPHSMRCYTRNTDRRIETRFYGIEEIGGEELVVTESFVSKAEVVEPSEQRKGDRVGQQNLLERLEYLTVRRTLVDPAQQPQTVADLDAGITKVRGMLR